MFSENLPLPIHHDTIVDILKQRAIQTPDKNAYIFLCDGEQKEITLTYSELDRRAKQVAYSLQSQYPSINNKRILLVYPQGLEFIIAFMGTLYAGAIAVLVNPPVNEKMARRVNGIVEDCEVSAVLSCKEVIEQMHRQGVLGGNASETEEELIRLKQVNWIDSETLNTTCPEQFSDVSRTLNDIAFLQYSSGSTGTPKGVMVSHKNLVANQQSIQHFMGINSDSVVVGWLPMIHDMGLIGNVLSPLYFGATLVFMTPLHFMRKPLRWLQAISRYRGTVSGGPNFAYGLCAAKVKESDLRHLDLSSWQVAFTGAEPVQRDTLDGFQRVFEPCGLSSRAMMPVYGLAEATLIVTGVGMDDMPDHNKDFQYVSNGRCVPGDTIKIVDPESRQEISEPGVEGEIWYSGDSVAKGYWNNPELTQSTFQARLEGDHRQYLRTGDTGFIGAGELYITGRMADIIIVKGRNFHAEDLEWSIQAIPGVRSGACAAFAISLAETESVVMVVGTDANEETQWPDLVEAIKQRLFSDYQLQLTRVVLVKPKQIPTTTSGKVRRKESRRMLQNGEFNILFDTQSQGAEEPSQSRENFVPAKTEDELKIAGIWSELLNVPISDIGMHDNFFELGGASLTMVELANQLGTSMEHLFRFPTISGYLNADDEYSFPPVEKDIYLPPAELDLSLTGTTNTTLISGAAGFFGLHFLQAMMQRSQQNFVLIIRGADQAHMRQKFESAVSYFDMQQDMDLSRIRFICGDLSQYRLGMSEEDWEWCATEVDRIVHIGSHVNNWLPYEGIKQINVDGTRTLLELARYRRKKEFHYTSTTTFIPEKADPSVFLESDDIDRNEINPYFGYDISKYASESMCKLARKEGLICNIYRLVWVGGQLSTGRAKVNDGFNIMLRILTTLGVYPAGHYPHDIVPVDLMAEGMASLVGKCENTDFNLTSLSKESISMERLVAMLGNMGYRLNEVSRAEFVERIRQYPIEQWDEYCRSYRQLVIRLFESEEQKMEAYYDSRNFRELIAPDVREKLERKFIDHWFEKKVAFLISQGALPTVSGLSWQQERDKISEMNNRRANYPVEQTLASLFMQQARKSPDALAVISKTEQITYQQLDRFSDCIARKIVEAGVPRDSFVGVCIGRHPLQMSALLGVLKAGCAYLPLDVTFTTSHLDFMVVDSGAKLILCDELAWNKMAHHGERLLTLSHPELHSEFADYSLADLQQYHRHESSDQLAYIIYTSGSTGKPKGVQLRQRTVINHNFNMIDAFQIKPQDRALQFTTLNFDVSVQEIFPIFFAGAAVVQVEREHLLELEQLPEIIAKNAVTLLSFPTAFWHACSHLPLQQAGARLVSIIGEQADLAKYNQFRDSNPDLPVFNGYGPTEATVIVTYQKLTGHLSSIDIGYPLNNVKIYILDDNFNPLPIGMVGKLYIAGDCLAKGYWNRPEKQQEVFISDPFSEGELMYDSGDLACWNADGSLSYKGRIDSQVKVNGYRIELDAIESALGESPDVLAGAVIVKDVSLKKRIVAFFKPAHENSHERGVREYLEQVLPNYMVPHLIIPLSDIPFNSNDKIDRNALRQLDVSALLGADYLAPKSQTEKLLCELWQSLLDIDQVSVKDNFFELGGHSLLLMQLITQLQNHNLIISAQKFITAKNLGDVAEILEQNSRKAATDFQVPENLIPPDCTHITPQMLPLITLSVSELDSIAAATPGGMSNIQDIYPLGPLQQGILFNHLLSKQHDPYIMVVTAEVVNEKALQHLLQSLQAIIDRHDVLRTGIIWQNLDTAVQVVLRQASLPITYLEPTCEPSDQDSALTLLSERDQWMDLTCAPLLQIDLLRTTGGGYVAQIRLHHIVSDQVGLEVIQKELVMIRKGMSQYLPYALPYRNFIAHTQQFANGDSAQKFFKSMLSGYEQTCAPFGLFNIQGDGSAVAEVSQKVPANVARQMVSLCKSLKITPAVILHCVWAIVVGRCSGRSDVVFGSVMSGRLQGLRGAADAMGVFINTLPVRVDFNAKSVGQLLNTVSETLFQLIKFEQVPLSEAQKCSDLQGTAPLFSSFLNYAHSDEASTDVKKVKLFEGVELLDLLRRTNYPFNLNVDHYGDNFILNLQIDKTVDCMRIMDYMQTCLAGFVNALWENEDKPVAELSILSQEELNALIFDQNRQISRYLPAQSIKQVFEAQVAKTPDAPALSFDYEQWTYEEVNQEANQLAHLIMACQSVSTDEGQSGSVALDTPLVALYFDKSIEMLISILAVLKAGAAYVPISPDYPQKRVQYILQDCQARLVLTQKKHLAGLIPLAASCDTAPTCIATDDSSVYNAASILNPDLTCPATSLAYVIYTSGTTGNPKGVMVEQHSVLNHMDGIKQTLGHVLTDVDFATNYCFDLSVTSYLFPLLSGGCVHIYHGDLTNPGEYAEHLKQNRVKFVKTTPSIAALMAPYLNEANIRLDSLLVGGEPLTRQCIEQLQPVTERLFNEYGPTEATIGTTATLVTHASQIHIGKAFLHVSLFVLSDDLSPVPQGVIGELYIGGAGVARGYLNRPELTAERFIDNPFGMGGKRLYRTGDLVRYLPDGNLEFIGRNDFQVKVNGYRIELAEIEKAILACQGVEQACVMLVDMAEKPVLSAFIKTSEPLLIEDIQSQIRQGLPDYMIPPRFVSLDAMPLTGNGKVDREALKALKSHLLQTITEPRNEIELCIYNIWAELLNTSDFGVEDNFFSLGGDSILCIKLVARLRSEGWTIQVNQIFDMPTVASLARLVSEQADKGHDQSHEQGELRGEFPLLPLQQLWLKSSSDDFHSAQVSGFIRLPEGITIETLQTALNRLLQHHDILRCRFELDRHPPLAVYQSEQDSHVEINVYDVQGSQISLAQLESAIIEQCLPFDLVNGRVMQAWLIKGGQFVPECLYLYLHPMVADDFSLRILAQDLLQLLQQQTLPIKTASYRQWEQTYRGALSGELRKEQDFWLSLLDDCQYSLPVTELAHRTSVLSLAVDPAISQLLQNQANQAYSTGIQDLLLSALSMVLHEMFQQDTVPLMLETDGREVGGINLDVSRTVGQFASHYAVKLPVVQKALDLENDSPELSTGVINPNAYDLNEMICQIKEILHSVPHAGLGVMALQSELEVPVTLPAVRFRYLDHYQSMSSSEEPGLLFIADRLVEGQLLQKEEMQQNNSAPCWLAIDCYWVQGQLQLHITSQMSASLNQKLLSSFPIALTHIVQHCLAIASEGGVKTPSDYGANAMSFEQLQKIQSKFETRRETTKPNTGRKNKLKV